jgi:hypothetical protein
MAWASRKMLATKMANKRNFTNPNQGDGCSAGSVVFELRVITPPNLRGERSRHAELWRFKTPTKNGKLAITFFINGHPSVAQNATLTICGNPVRNRLARWPGLFHK